MYAGHLFSPFQGFSAFPNSHARRNETTHYFQIACGMDTAGGLHHRAVASASDARRYDPVRPIQLGYDAYDAPYLTGVSQFAKLDTDGGLHIISRKKLLEADVEHRGVDTPLDAWYRTAKSAAWKSLDDVRRTYSHADGVPVGKLVYTVFNIMGNGFRLITEIFYKDQTILIRHVLTHAEYDKGDWKR